MSPKAANSVTEVNLENGEYKGIWSNKKIFVPCFDECDNSVDFVFEVDEELVGLGKQCSVSVFNKTAIVVKKFDNSYSGGVIDDKLILNDKV